jgi:hypothetical protein
MRPEVQTSRRKSTVLRGVARKRNLNTLRHETLAAFLAAAAEDIATGLAGHTGAEAELLFAGALGWLVGAFAHGGREK